MWSQARSGSYISLAWRFSLPRKATPYTSAVPRATMRDIRSSSAAEAAFSADDTLETGFSGIRKWVQDQFRKYPEKKELKLLFRVKKMSGGSIFLRPLHIAQEDGNTKSWACSIGKFKQYHCRKVSISAIGHIGEK